MDTVNRTMMNTLERTSVTFHPSVRCRLIPTEYTPNEIASMWYSRQEMREITKRCFLLMKKVETGKVTSGRKYCMRGLEGYSTLGSITRKTKRSNAVAAVLEEQERQLLENRPIDTQAIANAYRSKTARCQLCAIIRANRDSKDAAKAASRILSENTSFIIKENKRSSCEEESTELTCIGQSRQREAGFVSCINYRRERAT